ncbi:hypothetical protein M514_11234 [Trichuris suis]|uniref:Uncharacterized protein n=1 Tax=Trichuris suis TaxID=68888 RepID=A0A085N588_9BILA|nr:hypothetical protein M513_11234 [Trichuris suis]KFD64634.1 hypothetical protein M514_11234 [Trichuris suis]
MTHDDGVRVEMGDKATNGQLKPSRRPYGSKEANSRNVDARTLSRCQQPMLWLLVIEMQHLPPSRRDTKHVSSTLQDHI